MSESESHTSLSVDVVAYQRVLGDPELVATLVNEAWHDDAVEVIEEHGFDYETVAEAAIDTVSPHVADLSLVDVPPPNDGERMHVYRVGVVQFTDRGDDLSPSANPTEYDTSSDVQDDFFINKEKTDDDDAENE